MNAKLTPIFARRSIRHYTGQPVTDDQLQDVLEAAMAAPSAVAKDPWHFIVVRDPEMLQKIADGLPHGKFVTQAGLCIVVCGDLDKAHGNELSYLIQDCSAAIENILLAAAALGLGACWLGVHPREDRVKHLRALLHLPDHIIPLSGIAVGHPAESKPPRTRFRQEAVHFETW